MEIGVAMLAFDADKLEGRLGIRPSAPGEKFEGLVGSLTDGTLVIADEKRPVAVLFGDTAEGRGVHPDTERTLLAAIGVKGVPDIALEEALWLAASAMRA
jgi:DNA/RNA-binding domain of Phe-tRNA-synthetase-like protein